MSGDLWLAELAVLATLGVTAALADRLARARRPGGERGDFWSRLAARVCVVVGLPVLLSGWLKTIAPSIWERGVHLQLDCVTHPPVGGVGTSFALALALPVLLWLLLLGYGLLEKPGDREAGRWLAGGAGFSSSRRWVLACAVPLVACLIAGAPDLGGGPQAYPGAAWTTLALLVACLGGVAASAGAAPAAAALGAAKEEADEPGALAPWPAALRDAGVHTAPLATWKASPEPRGARQGARAALEDKLAARGARGMAPEALEAVSALLDEGGGDAERSCLLLGPDGCGQIEAVAVAAELLAQRSRDVTLVVSPGDAGEIVAELNRWLPAVARAAPVGTGGEVPREAAVWVVDAATLSERFLRRVRDESLVARLGLVVWWDVHEYTGVLAANMWAVSRRLDRLVRKLGRADVRTLALVRSATAPEAELGRFVQRLLPHQFRQIRAVYQQPREVQIHLLAAHQDYFGDDRGRLLPEAARHPVLVAALASMEARWPTHVDRPPAVTDVEWESFLRTAVRGRTAEEEVVPSPAEAGARLLTVSAAGALSLGEIMIQGGRAEQRALPHHVGIAPPTNPYVAHVVAKLRASGGSGYRRLVGAEGQESIVERHLLLALSELEDTDTGLRNAALWKDAVLQRTLESLSERRFLRSREVRSLVNGRLKFDRVYRSTQGTAADVRPLDTAGTDPIPVREVAGGKLDEGIRMMVDAERLGIKAYPGRVFRHRGRRYRVRDWNSLDEVRKHGRVECELIDAYEITWRERTVRVPRIEVEGMARHVSHGKRRLVSRQVATVLYEEEVRGTIVHKPNLTTGGGKTWRTSFPSPIRSQFPTKALLLEIAGADDDETLESLAQALRHALPVHVGVEDDALEVVPVVGRGRAELALVDLFPGGIGVVDAIFEDDALPLHVLDRVREWLAACSCSSNEGCPKCLRSPETQATDPDGVVWRAKALAALDELAKAAKE